MKKYYKDEVSRRADYFTKNKLELPPHARVGIRLHHLVTTGTPLAPLN